MGFRIIRDPFWEFLEKEKIMTPCFFNCYMLGKPEALQIVCADKLLKKTHGVDFPMLDGSGSRAWCLGFRTYTRVLVRVILGYLGLTSRTYSGYIKVLRGP